MPPHGTTRHKKQASDIPITNGRAIDPASAFDDTAENK